MSFQNGGHPCVVILLLPGGASGGGLRGREGDAVALFGSLRNKDAPRVRDYVVEWFRHGRAEHVARGDLGNAQALHQAPCLGALAGPGRPEKQEARGAHRASRPRMRVPLAKPSYWRDTRWASTCAIVSSPTPTTISSAVPPK